MHGECTYYPELTPPPPAYQPHLCRDKCLTRRLLILEFFFIWLYVIHVCELPLSGCNHSPFFGADEPCKVQTPFDLFTKAADGPFLINTSATCRMCSYSAAISTWVEPRPHSNPIQHLPSQSVGRVGVASVRTPNELHRVQPFKGFTVGIERGGRGDFHESKGGVSCGLAGSTHPSRGRGLRH